jgi:hypothetical protein
MTDLLIVEGGQNGVHEVETEFEDDEEEEQNEPDEADEVEEEVVGDDAVPVDHRGESDPGNYAVPEESKEVWRNFGYDNPAGRALRKLYAGASKDAAAKVSYPRLVSPARRWEPEVKQPRPCPQRARVAVPKPARRMIDRDDPRYWYTPAPGRKPEAEIRAEMEAQRPERPNLVPGRDQGAEKLGLQQKFRYAGGNAMPPGAMGHVPKGEVPDAVASRREQPERWDHIDETGLTKEQRGIFADLTAAIQDKQARLAVIDSHERADDKPSKVKTQRNREALQLQNDIQSHVRDIDKLLEISEE